MVQLTLVYSATANGPRPVNYGHRAVFGRVKLRDGSRPTPSEPPVSLEASERTRRVNCARYTNCLDYACGEAWHGWTCGACHVRDVLSPADQAGQLSPLADLLREVAGPGAVRLRNGSFWGMGLGARR